jgi:hypothetical protein
VFLVMVIVFDFESSFLYSNLDTLFHSPREVKVRMLCLILVYFECGGFVLGFRFCFCFLIWASCFCLWFPLKGSVFIFVSGSCFQRICFLS